MPESAFMWGALLLASRQSRTESQKIELHATSSPHNQHSTSAIPITISEITADNVIIPSGKKEDLPIKLHVSKTQL